MPNSTQKPARLTTRQVADQLGKSVSQITRYASDLDVEKLPGKTGHYLFTADDVAKIRALIAQHQTIGDES